MASNEATSPFIKDEPEDGLFSSNGHQRYMGSGQQQFGVNIPQQHFNQFGNSMNHGGSINPNDLMAGGTPMSVQNSSYMGSSFQNNFGQSSNPNASFSKGISVIDDDDLLDSLPNESHNNAGAHNNGQDFNSLGDFDFNLPQNMYNQNGTPNLSIDQANMNGYSNTPDGDPIQSPFVHSFNALQFRQIQNQQQFSSSMQSPTSFAGSPLAGSDMHNGSMENSYMTAKNRPRLSQSMQRKSSNTRSPLTPKTPGLAVQSMNMNGADHSSFQGHPIRNTLPRHQKAVSGQWDQTPSSLASFPGSEFGSPIPPNVHPNAQISDLLKTGSLPPKLGATSAQDMKRRRRRESHNLVERRRRDNINERIQELSHLVPMHRLEDEKVRKALQNNSPLSPTLTGFSHSPPQATSGLAGPGARRATAGNITQGIPIEEKDKGPNKGDILNGAVSWTRDLMWMLHAKLQQQEELASLIAELGGQWPFEQTEDEKRMHSELSSAMRKNSSDKFSYSRAHGSGLRVPDYTDPRGDPVGAAGGQPGGNNGVGIDALAGMSPDEGEGPLGGDLRDQVGGAQHWSTHNDGSGPGSIGFKEEDEWDMDLN